MTSIEYTALQTDGAYVGQLFFEYCEQRARQNEPTLHVARRYNTFLTPWDIGSHQETRECPRVQRISVSYEWCRSYGLTRRMLERNLAPTDSRGYVDESALGFRLDTYLKCGGIARLGRIITRCAFALAT